MTHEEVSTVRKFLQARGGEAALDLIGGKFHLRRGQLEQHFYIEAASGGPKKMVVDRSHGHRSEGRGREDDSSVGAVGATQRPSHARAELQRGPEDGETRLERTKSRMDSESDGIVGHLNFMGASLSATHMLLRRQDATSLPAAADAEGL